METHPPPEGVSRLPSLICKNCSAVCAGNYCWRCGQATSTCRITLRRILSDSLTTLFDLDDQGFFHTALQLTQRPAGAIRNYLAGQRVAYFPPQKYLFWVGAVVTFLTARFHVYAREYAAYANPLRMSDLLSRFFQYADASGTLINIISIPVFALFSALFFRKASYNYAEHLVLNTYLTAQELLFFVGITGMVALSPFLRDELLPLYAFGTLLYNGWTLYQLFHTSTNVVFLRIAGALVLSYAGQFGVNLVVFWVVEKVF